MRARVHSLAHPVAALTAVLRACSNRHLLRLDATNGVLGHPVGGVGQDALTARNTAGGLPWRLPVRSVAARRALHGLPSSSVEAWGCQAVQEGP